MSMLLSGAVAFCQWWDITGCAATFIGEVIAFEFD